MLEIAWFLTDNHYMSIITILCILLCAYCLSSNRRAISYMVALRCFFLQIGLVFVLLKTTQGRVFFIKLAENVAKLYQCATAGCDFMFGSLANSDGPWGFVFAFKVLPVIIFFGSFIAILFHLRVIQFLVMIFAKIMHFLVGVSGSEMLAVVASCFLAQTEAPLLVKNYLHEMSDSQIFAIMVSGMAHLSCAIIIIYGMMGVPLDHLIVSSIIALPGVILIAKIMVPDEKNKPIVTAMGQICNDSQKSILDVIAGGAIDGLSLAANIAAVLIAFISIMALINAILIATCGCGLNDIFGFLFGWVAYGIGIPYGECKVAGALLGQKFIINEFIAYGSMLRESLSERTLVIITYALAGFANISSIGIQIGGISTLCPIKKLVVTSYGFKALIGATLVNLLNAALISLVI